MCQISTDYLTKLNASADLNSMNEAEYDSQYVSDEEDKLITGLKDKVKSVLHDMSLQQIQIQPVVCAVFGHLYRFKSVVSNVHSD